MTMERRRPGLAARVSAALAARAPMVLVAVLVTAAAAYITTLFHDEIYRSTSIVELRDAALDEMVVTMESVEIHDAVVGRLGEAVPAAIATVAGPDLLRVAVHAESPATAAIAANAYMDAFLVQGSVSMANVLEPAVAPSSPIEPEPLRSTLFGALAGLGLGLVAAGVAHRRQPRHLTAEQRHDRVAPHAVLGEYSMSNSPWPLGTEISDPKRELVRSIFHERSILRADARVIQVVAVHLTQPATELALHIARVLSERGTRAIVIDAAVTQPELHRALGVSRAPGLADVLRGEPLDMVVLPISDTFAAIVAGDISGNPMAILSSRQMEATIEVLRSDFDQVIIVSPSLDLGGAAAAASRLSDVAVLVVTDHDDEGAVHDAIDALAATSVTILGAVFATVDGQHDA